MNNAQVMFSGKVVRVTEVGKDDAYYGVQEYLKGTFICEGVDDYITEDGYIGCTLTVHEGNHECSNYVRWLAYAKLEVVEQPEVL